MSTYASLPHLSEDKRKGGIHLRVLICGDRKWNNFKLIEDFILSLPKDTVIIEGDCRGADKISGFLARKHGLEVIPFPAKWEEYGLRAGPIRNQQMLDEGKPDLVVAFHNNLKDSKGTKDMVNKAIVFGVQVRLIKEEFT
jgi:hypothetical protein